MLDSLYTVPAGQPLAAALDFRAYGAVVDNITNQWYYESSRRRFIPPYQSGATIPLVGTTVGTIACQPPGQIVQATPISGEYLTVSFTEIPLPAGLGINVSGQAGPTTVSGLAVDIAEGGQPAVPNVNVLRLWADANNLLRSLDSGAVARALVAFSGAAPTASGIPKLSAALASDTSFSNAAYVTLCSLSIPASTVYLVWAWLTMVAPAGGAITAEARLADLATNYASAGAAVSAAAEAAFHLGAAAVTGPQTVNLQAISNSALVSTAKAATVVQSIPNASGMGALRVA